MRKQDKIARKSKRTDCSAPNLSQTDRGINSDRKKQEDLSNEENTSKFTSKRGSSKINDDDDTEDAELRRERR